MMLRKTSALAATMVLTFLTGSPALAQQISRVVHHYDLDFTGRAGTRAFRHRLQHAVNTVCRATGSNNSLTENKDQDCRAAVMAKVEPQMLVAIELAQAGKAELVGR